MEDRKPTILLVDDETDLLEITASILEVEGYTVITAESVDIAIERIKSVLPDIIVSDITMPVKTGFDFLTYVRSQSQLQNIPFLFLSAHADIESIKTGKEQGIDDYLTKPVDYHLLLSTIKGKLKRKEELRKAFSDQTEQFKNQIFRLISHEMKTPLTSILGATELLSDSKEQFSQSELTEYLQMLQKSGKRLTSMVDDFLTAMKIESGEMLRDMHIVDTEINPRLAGEHLVMQFKELIQSHDLHIENHLPDRSVPVHLHLQHFEEIVRRIFDNAVKFSPDKGRIQLSMTTEGASVVFSIQDNGCGIPKEVYGKLFEKFEQINRAKNEQQGSGLGLYIAGKLAVANNMKLSFDSEEGKGTTFFLTIPTSTPTKKTA
jgi:two-component system sensor histidine kinase/response regulator